MSNGTGITLAPALLAPDSPPDSFPPVEFALKEPNGLLAIGASLSPERLLFAYRNAIFPWYSDDQPILWWSPEPRFVIFPDAMKISRSLRKRLRQQHFDVSVNQSFDEVMEECAKPRTQQDGTWITEEMKSAYRHMHALGHALSIECWQEGKASWRPLWSASRTGVLRRVDVYPGDRRIQGGFGEPLPNGICLD